ncbi:MAG: NIPSNAP family protein [Methylacidiphilaceae bacterium]|nr:NIPSNAP family protein [Candidatus Methylacidiphilaceae bacterium]
MIYELREYRIKAGRLDEFVRFMDEELLPFQASKGVKVIGSFTVPGEPTRYVWIRAFADGKERERICQEVYGSSDWENRFLAKLNELMDREAVEMSLLKPTPGSKLG